MWLKPPIDEDGSLKGGKKNKKGTPQGGVISPLLANIYLNLVDKLVNKNGGPFSNHSIKIIRYADDFILMGKSLPEKVLRSMNYLLDRMELKINEEKSKRINALEDSFDFFGYTIRYDRSIKFDRGKYWNICPSKNSINKMHKNIKIFLKKSGHFAPERIADGLNGKIRAWFNYYNVEGVSYTWKDKRDLNWYLRERLQRFYKRKSQRKSKLHCQGAFNVLISQYGLIDPIKY